MSTFQLSAPDITRTRGQFAALAGQFAVISLIFLSITTPPIRISEDFPYLKTEQVLFSVMLVIYIWLELAGYLRAFRISRMMIAGAVFTISILFSMWYGSVILGHGLLLRDFYEIPKIWFPVAFFTLAYEADLSESTLRRLLGWFCAAMLLVCLYAWAQWLSLGFSFSLNPYYSGGEHIDGGLLRYRRVYSTMGNPNVLGQLLSWAISAFALAALAQVRDRIVYIAAALACLLTLAMTGSRYGLLTSILGLALIFAMPSASRRRSTQLIIAVILLLPLFALAFNAIASSNRNTLERYSSLSAPLQIDSLRDRLDVLWRDAETDIAQSPLLGHGPAKTIYTGVITDSEYLDVFKQFGIIGFVPYIAYFLIPFFLIYPSLRASAPFREILNRRLPATSLTANLGVIMVITALVMNIGESTLYNQVLQGFLWLWLGLSARSARTLSDATERITRVARAKTWTGSTTS